MRPAGDDFDCRKGRFDFFKELIRPLHAITHQTDTKVFGPASMNQFKNFTGARKIQIEHLILKAARFDGPGDKAQTDRNALIPA